MKSIIIFWILAMFLLKTIAIWIIWDLVLSPIFGIEPLGLRALLIALAWTLAFFKIQIKEK